MRFVARKPDGREIITDSGSPQPLDENRNDDDFCIRFIIAAARAHQSRG